MFRAIVRFHSPFSTKRGPVSFETIKCIPWMDAGNLSFTASKLAARGPYNTDVWDKIISRADSIGDKLQLKHLSNILSAMQSSKTQHNQVFLKRIHSRHIPVISLRSENTGLNSMRLLTSLVNLNAHNSETVDRLLPSITFEISKNFNLDSSTPTTTTTTKKSNGISERRTRKIENLHPLQKKTYSFPDVHSDSNNLEEMENSIQLKVSDVLRFMQAMQSVNFTFSQEAWFTFLQFFSSSFKMSNYLPWIVLSALKSLLATSPFAQNSPSVPKEVIELLADLVTLLDLKYEGVTTEFLVDLLGSVPYSFPSQMSSLTAELADDAATQLLVKFVGDIDACCLAVAENHNILTLLEVEADYKNASSFRLYSHLYHAIKNLEIESQFSSNLQNELQTSKPAQLIRWAQLMKEGKISGPGAIQFANTLIHRLNGAGTVAALMDIAEWASKTLDPEKRLERQDEVLGWVQIRLIDLEDGVVDGMHEVSRVLSFEWPQGRDRFIKFWKERPDVITTVERELGEGLNEEETQLRMSRLPLISNLEGMGKKGNVLVPIRILAQGKSVKRNKDV